VEIRDLKKLARFSEEKLLKIPVFQSEKMFFDLYALVRTPARCGEWGHRSWRPSGPFWSPCSTAPRQVDWGAWRSAI
jgi:hypothetical protein